MTRLDWYRHLRKGWEPMKASHAWTQALAYEGKELGDVYFLRPNGDPLETVTKLTIANYANASFKNLVEHGSFARLLAGRRR